MFTFLTLKDLYEYIPNCIICGKEMKLSLSGQHSKFSQVVPNYQFGASTKSSVHLKSYIKNNTILFKNKKFSFSIDRDTNKIIDGAELVNNLCINWMFISKGCITCDFKIQNIYNDGSTKKLEIFPPLKHVEERIHYTMKRGTVTIHKHFYDDSTLLGETTQITVNRKPITQSIHLDFSKFKNLKQLNRRLETIIMFQ